MQSPSSAVVKGAVRVEGAGVVVDRDQAFELVRARGVGRRGPVTGVPAGLVLVERDDERR